MVVYWNASRYMPYIVQEDMTTVLRWSKRRMRGMEYDGVKYTSGQRTWHVVSRLFLNLENQRNRSSNFVSPYNKYLKSVCNKTGCRMPRRSHLVSLTCHVMSLNFHQSTRDDRHSPRGKTRRPQYQCTTHSPRMAVVDLQYSHSAHQYTNWVHGILRTRQLLRGSGTKHLPFPCQKRMASISAYSSSYAAVQVV